MDVCTHVRLDVRTERVDQPLVRLTSEHVTLVYHPNVERPMTTTESFSTIMLISELENTVGNQSRNLSMPVDVTVCNSSARDVVVHPASSLVAFVFAQLGGRMSVSCSKWLKLTSEVLECPL